MSITDQTNSAPTDAVIAEAQLILGQYHAYDSQIELPEIKGTRIVKCLYQINKQTGQKVKDSAYVRIPDHIDTIAVEARINDLAPYVVTFLQSVEDGMIKAEHKVGQLSVFCDALSIDKLITRMDELELGARLNADKIEAWFKEVIADDLGLLFATKLGIDDNSGDEDINKLALIITAYQKKFASLASGKTNLKPEDCVAMIAVIESVVDNGVNTVDPMSARFIHKLTRMQDKEQDTLLAL